MSVKIYYDEALAKEHLNNWHPDLQVEFERQAGLYAFWNSMYVQAEKQHDRYANLAEMVEAKLDRVCRKALHDAGEKATEGQVRAAVKIDSRMQDALELVRTAKEQVGLCKGMCEAMRQRKDMLLQMGFRERDELKSNPQVNRKSLQENRRDRVSNLSNLDPEDFEV